MSKYKILSLDGGGIRGLITAMLIQELDKETGFLKNVDLFAGTSTGGIISVALASGASIEELVNMYGNVDSCKTIFKRYIPRNIFEIIAGILKKIIHFNWGQILYVKYTDKGLISILKKVLGKEKLLADLDKKALVTTFQLDDSAIDGWVPISLSSFDKKAPNKPLVSNLDAALSTSAAPTYFPPHYVDGYGYLTDGGTFANNPSVFAYARALDANRGLDRDDVTVLSIGTGYSSSRIPETAIKDPYKCGYLFWVKGGNGAPALPILSMLFDGGTSEKDTYELNEILGKQSLRLNPMLKGEISLDNYKEIPKLKKIANDFINSPEWPIAVDWVKKNFS